MILAMCSWIIFGLLVGIIAKFLLPESQNSGLFVTTLLGIGGAIIGGFLANVFGYGIDEVGGPGFTMSLLLAIVGAIFILAIYGMEQIEN